MSWWEDGITIHWLGRDCRKSKVEEGKGKLCIHSKMGRDMWQPCPTLRGGDVQNSDKIGPLPHVQVIP